MSIHYAVVPFSSEAHAVWMLVSSFLVLFMTLPGLALFYGGLVQHKNVVSVYAQCIAIAGITSIIWVFGGYSLAFSHTGAWSDWIGNLSHLGLLRERLVVQDIPHVIYISYQLAFAIIAQVIIVGGFAERMKFSASLLFAIFWCLLVYCPIVHWFWGGGWLEKMHVMDFAGGSVVHINAGVAGLIAAIYLGRRKHFSGSYHPNLTYLTIGTSILWIGWFGFNAGSAHTITDAGMALLNTQLAPATAALVWMLLSWIKRGKPSASRMLMGAVSGLVAVTPACGYISPVGAMVIGGAGALVCFIFVQLKTVILRFDDALDAFGIHGVGGIVGSLLTGVLASKALDGTGFFAGSMAAQMKVQVISILATMAWCGVVSWIVLFCLDKCIGIRVPPEQEEKGLDHCLHGEEAVAVQTHLNQPHLP